MTIRLLTTGLLAVLLAGVLAAAGPTVRVLKVDGAIGPVTADYLRRNLNEAARQGDRLVLVEIDTPGGLDSAMREIVKDFFASPVPVAVYVGPGGARAASAGAIIALAADVCAMAPGTTIGAAHPVSLGVGEKPDKTMEAKILNDAEAYAEGIARKRGHNEELARRMVRESISLAADKALEGKVADLLAADRSDLLKRLEGWPVARDGRTTPLLLAGAVVREHPMGTRERILAAIGNPNVAYVLLMLGLLGLFFELSNPGVILPGVIGGISLLLGLFALQTLPVNYAGVLLILFGLVLFIAEIKVVSYGMLTVGGIIAMVFGSLLLFESPEPALRLSWGVLVPTVLVTAGFAVFAVIMAVRAQRRRPTTGREGLVGEVGRAESDLAPEGKVFVRGEYWDARCDEPIAAGEQVVVERVEGMRLTVRRITARD